MDVFFFLFMPINDLMTTCKRSQLESVTIKGSPLRRKPRLPDWCRFFVSLFKFKYLYLSRTIFAYLCFLDRHFCVMTHSWLCESLQNTLSKKKMSILRSLACIGVVTRAAAKSAFCLKHTAAPSRGLWLTVHSLLAEVDSEVKPCLGLGPDVRVRVCC